MNIKILSKNNKRLFLRICAIVFFTLFIVFLCLFCKKQKKYDYEIIGPKDNDAQTKFYNLSKNITSNDNLQTIKIVGYSSCTYLKEDDKYLNTILLYDENGTNPMFCRYELNTKNQDDYPPKNSLITLTGNIIPVDKNDETISGESFYIDAKKITIGTYY